MTHFGIVCPNATGHLNPMAALCDELRHRGHQTTLLSVADSEKEARELGLAFFLIGQQDFPPGSSQAARERIAKSTGLKALKYTTERLVLGAEMCLRELPDAIQKAQIDALLVDQVTPAVGTVAEYLGIPFITICNALMLNREPEIPPAQFPWKYSTSWFSQLRNKLVYWYGDKVIFPVLKPINKARKKWHLPIFKTIDEAYSPLAQITQQPRDFEFPRKSLPENFYFTGPFWKPKHEVDFPYEKLTGQPLIYASLGTVQNGLVWIFKLIAEACVDLDVQLVMSVGWALNLEEVKFPGNPIVVNYAPQAKLLQQASLSITHAGLNTTLGALSNGVPMVAIPISQEQPGIAERIALTKTGEVIALKKVNAQRLKEMVQQVLTNNIYQQNALKLQKVIQQSEGVQLAADLIEEAISTS